MGLLIATRRAMLTIGGVTYLLNDSFNDEVAAGAVDGTAATPGPGTRTAVDTGNNASITGGAFVVAAVAGNGDPGLWYDEAQTRVLGRYLKGQLNSDTGGRTHIGWDANQSGHADTQSIGQRVSTIRIKQGATEIVVGVHGAGIYTYAIVLRAAGAYYFVKGVAFTSWTLLWVDSTISTATLYPGITAATGAFNLYFMRIPDRLFIPPVALYDTFTRANGALGDSETTGPDSQPVTARTWESGGVTWAIAGNEAVNTPGVGGEALTDPGLEANYTAGLCDTLSTSGAATYVQSADAHGGSKAQQFTATANGGRCLWSTASVIGTWYQLSIWSKRTAGAAGVVNVEVAEFVVGGWDFYKPITSVAYEQHFFTIRSLNGSNIGLYAARQLGAAPFDTIISDDGSMKALTLNTLFTDVDDGATSDYLAEVELDTVVAGTQAGMVLNLDDATTPANFVIAYHDGTNAYLDKCVAGTYTSVISAAATYAAGAKLVVVKQGTSYALYYNNAKIGSTSTISDAGIISNTKHGLFSTNSGNQLDNFTVFYWTNAAYDTELDLV